MRYDFTDEQHALRDSVTRLFDATLSGERLRALSESDTGRDPEIWRGLCDIGVPAILIPERYEGVGGDDTDLVLIMEQAGYACVPDALLESCVLAPALLCESQDEDLKKTWLPSLAAGRIRATAALSDSPYVPDAHVSDIVLREDSDGLHLYRREEIEIHPVTSMDPARRLFEVRATGSGVTVRLSEDARNRVLARRNVASASLLNGVAQAFVEQSVAYVKVRRQFGREIGSFQAVKHQLATAFSLNQLARQAASSAAYSVANDDATAADAAQLAKVCALDAEFESNRVALQLHGGIGFTWEHDLQFWLKRGKVLEQAYGRASAVRRGAGRTGLQKAAHAI